MSCYYSANHPGSYEKGARLKEFDLALVKCEGGIQSVSLYIKELSNDLNLFGCDSVLDLLNVRSNGELVIPDNESDAASRTICNQHFKSLTSNWELRGHKSINNRQSRSKNHSCALKCPLPHTKFVSAESRRVVDKAMCIAWLKVEGVLIPPGTILCRRHQGLLTNAKEKKIKEDDKDYEPGDDPMEFDEFDLFDLKDNNHLEEYQSDSPTSQTRRTLPTEVICAVSQLVRALGGDRVLTRGEWKDLTEGTKRKKVSLVKRIFEAVCEVITPDGKDDLYTRTITQTRSQEDSKLANKIFDAIDERFVSLTLRQEKVKLLSLISDLGLTMKELVRCVPSASMYYLNEARTFNKGGIDFETHFQRENFDAKKVDRLVEFLSRSNVLITQPWGDTLATMSDGTKTPIASVARRFTFTRTYRLYLKDLEASALSTNEMHLKLSRGSMTKILKILAKRRNERMMCVDEFAADAYEAWKQIVAVVEELKLIHGLIGESEERSLKRWIRIARSHLEGEYVSEVCEESNVPQHCSRFSLSDKTRKCYASKCDHAHDGKCQNCDQFDSLLGHLKALTGRLSKEASPSPSGMKHRLDRLHQIIVFSCETIRTYQAHLLRTALSNSGRAQIQENLSDGHALLTLDFSMKILPLKSIEAQSDFFGKRGITLHLAHCLAKINGNMVDHLFAHTLDEVTQNSALVCAIVRHIVSMLQDKGITKIYFRSDNAGSYKNGALIASLYHLTSPKIIIAGYFFSESQAGKGPADRGAAHCKRKTGEWTRADNNLTNARHVYEALTVDNETVRGLSAFYCTFTDTSVKTVNVFPGIQHFFSFDYEDEGVRTRCQYGIGEGKITKKERLPDLDCSLDVVEGGGHLGDSFWNPLASKEQEEFVVEEDEEGDAESDMFACSTFGCIRSFRSTRWLIEHEIRGNHEFAVKRKAMTDRAVEKFNELIETREVARIAVSEQLDTVGDYGKDYAYDKGWALKSSHISNGLNITARKLAEEYFNAQRSMLPPRRAEAAFMRMKLLNEIDYKDPSGTKYLLEYSQVPSEKQLTSLFSRLERLRTQGPKNRMSKGGRPSNPGKKGTRSRGVKSTGDTRKRRRESSSEEEDMNLEEGEEEEEVEIEGSHEDDFIRTIIDDEKNNIFS